MSDGGIILASVRGRAGLSQRALARRAGVPPSTVSRIERGDVDPTIGMLRRLTEAAGLELLLTATPAVPTIAAAVEASGNEPNWTRFKAVVDWLNLHPDDAAIVINEAPDLDDATPQAANLAAAVAERVARLHGLVAPEWTRRIPPLDERWEHRGTPRMVERSRAAAPEEFKARNIWLAADAIWSH